MQAYTFLSYVKHLHDRFIAGQQLRTIITALSQQQNATPTNGPKASVVRAKPTPPATRNTNDLIRVIASVETLFEPLFNASYLERQILSGLGADAYAKPETYADLRSQARSNPNEGVSVRQQLQQGLTQFMTKLSSLQTQLQNISLTEHILDPNDGIVEITFDGDRAIDNLVEAKDEFNDWNLILEGYSRILGCTKEDFQIVRFEKASPTKVTIRTTLEIASWIITIIAGLIAVEQRFVQTRTVIEQVKTTRLVDPDSDTAYVKKAEEALKEKATEEVKQLAETILAKTKTKDAEAATFFTRGVEQQFQFIVSGGTVNVYLGSNATNEQLEQLDSMRHESERLKAMTEDARLKTDTARKEITAPLDTNAQAPLSTSTESQP